MLDAEDLWAGVANVRGSPFKAGLTAFAVSAGHHSCLVTGAV